MRRIAEVGLCVALAVSCRASERGGREVAPTPAPRSDSGVVAAAAGPTTTTTGPAQVAVGSEAVSPEERGAGAPAPSDAVVVAAAKLDVGAPVDAAAPDTCAELREDVEDGEVSMTACRILESTELGGARLEVVEVELDDPGGADELRAVFVAMRADGDTYFVSLVEAREVPGQIEEYTVERLEVRGESVRIPYTMTTTTYATAGPGSTGEVDREVDVGALVCEPRTQGCVRE
ncbi:MAG: hypothetical protein KC486_01455 [Myxococcales bacterium]|nr:hypothetical protein [Myxococcales bacterium]